MKLLGLAACASAAMASFSDSAPFYSSRKLSADSAYLARSGDVAKSLSQLSGDFCSDGEQLHIYRVNNLAAKAPAEHTGTFFENVHYRGVDDLERVVDSFFHQSGQNPQIFDLEDDEYSVEEFLDKSSCVIVQGKPSFHRAGSGLDAVKQFIEDVSDKFKRETVDEYEKELEEELQELEAEQQMDAEVSKEAAEVLDEEEEQQGDSDALDTSAVDAVVSAVSDAEALLDDAEMAEPDQLLSVSSLSTKSNLFTQYQFFTPGVWLAIIVSLFLVYVVSTAVGWITSIQTSYHSFEKLVDYEKKTE